MQIIDPDGLQKRKGHRLLRRKYSVPGPNFIWYVDGNDKLKPFEFAIHGSIDGYSRRILWLVASFTYIELLVVASFNVDCLLQLGLVPKILRCDLGTENLNLEFSKPLFRRDCNDSFALKASWREKAQPVKK